MHMCVYDVYRVKTLSCNAQCKTTCTSFVIVASHRLFKKDLCKPGSSTSLGSPAVWFTLDGHIQIPNVVGWAVPTSILQARSLGHWVTSHLWDSDNSWSQEAPVAFPWVWPPHRYPQNPNPDLKSPANVFGIHLIFHKKSRIWPIKAMFFCETSPTPTPPPQLLRLKNHLLSFDLLDARRLETSGFFLLQTLTPKKPLMNAFSDWKVSIKIPMNRLVLELKRSCQSSTNQTWSLNTWICCSVPWQLVQLVQPCLTLITPKSCKGAWRSRKK